VGNGMGDVLADGVGVATGVGVAVAVGIAFAAGAGGELTVDGGVAAGVGAGDCRWQ
jgi:hypothetical protein